MTQEEIELAQSLANESISILKRTTEQQLIYSMERFAMKYHKKRIMEKNIDDIQEILKYYYEKYRFNDYSKRYEDIAKAIYNYFVGSEKSKQFLTRIKEENNEGKIKRR